MKHSLSRRQLIAGLSTVIALPLLSSATRESRAAGLPKRFVVFYVPEGVEKATFWPSAGGSLASLPPSLAPLAAWKSEITLVKGVASKTGFHSDGVDDMLTGGLDSAAREYGGIGFPAGVSVDRVIAAHIHGGARFSSYDLGIQSFEGNRVFPISFDSNALSRGSINSPLKCYDDLLGGLEASAGETPSPEQLENKRRLILRKSILDDVTSELNALKCGLSIEDRGKLEVHVESIRSVEKQIDSLLTGAALPEGLTLPARDGSLSAESAYKDPANYQKVGKLQMDILLTALAAGTTRVATLQWSKTLPRFSTDFVEGLQNHNGWHDVSHNGPGTDAGLIVRWHAQQYAYFLEGLEQRGILEDTLVLWVSEMSEGNHSSNDIPYILAGSAGGAFKKGLFLDLFSGGKWRFNNDLLATLVRGFGIPTDSFGTQRSEDKKRSLGVINELLV